MTTYAPTVNPGDTRRRARYVGIWIPLSQQAAVEVLEQDVVRLPAGEVVLRDLGPIAGIGVIDLIDPAALGATFPVVDPATDQPTGQTATVAQAFQLIHSWVRAQQAARDAQEPTP